MTELETLRERVEMLEAKVQQLEALGPVLAGSRLNAPPVQGTDHPYIIRIPGVRGGAPITRNACVSVRAIVELVLSGQTPLEILASYAPALSPIEVADALSYYLHHREEIDGMVAANEEAFARVAEFREEVRASPRQKA